MRFLGQRKFVSKVFKRSISSTKNDSYDAIIVGGGHNGLVAAAYLAKAGKKVTVLERRHLIGIKI